MLLFNHYLFMISVGVMVKVRASRDLELAGVDLATVDVNTLALTNRGNETSAVRSLWAGALVVLSFQPYIMPYWSKVVFGNSLEIAWPWWFFFGGLVSFLVCVAGKPSEELAA